MSNRTKRKTNRSRLTAREVCQKFCCLPSFARRALSSFVVLETLLRRSERCQEYPLWLAAQELRAQVEATMKAVLQRVTSASVTVDQQLISSVGRGLLVFAAIGKEDTEKDADSMAAKVLKARLWPDENKPESSWKKNVRDIQGEILCVSQFTLYGRMKKGNKPDFHNAADIETARRLYDYFYKRVEELYVKERVKNGVFQAMMEVELKNDGPVGVDYHSEDGAVTIEISTDVPQSESSSSDRGKDEQDGPDGELGGSKYVEFKLPASLLE